ncbi:MAG: TonB-dependent receptor [Pseudomonadales bacterium]
MHFRHMVGVCALALSFAVPAVAAAAEEATIEEIVVTAQKREQSLQDVPISVSAFSGEDISALGTTHLDQLTEFIPGAELFDDRGAGQPTWVIRGVGLADFNSNNTPTAAIYQDEVYLTSNVLGGLGLFDTDRVEVLKGPQGGLYGRNTSGGAVLVHSTRASAEDGVNGYVTGRYGRWDRYGIEGAVGVPVGDAAALRLSMMTDQDGGWQDSLATPEDDEYGDRDFTAVRGQLAWQISDRFDLWLKVEGGEDKSETTLGYSRALFDPATGDFCSAAYGGRHDESGCVAWSNLTNLYALTPGDPGVLPGGQSESGKTVLTRPINALDNNWIGTTLQLDWHLDFATLTSITGYMNYEDNQVYDYDSQPLTLFEEDTNSELTLWSQELRLVSNGEGPFSWLLGAMYAEDDVDDERLGDLSDNVLILPVVGRRGFDQEAASWAVYAQGDYRFAPAWQLSASVRYTDEDRDFNDVYFEDLSNGFYYYEGVDVSTSLDDHWSGHVGLQWLPTDDAMLYGTITRGFKSGGFFGGFAFTPEELQPYGEETVTSYEVGFKTTWLEQTLRLNGAVFYYDYQDVQGFTQVFSDVSNTVITRLGNLGDAEHTGAELEAIWVPTALDGLTLQLAAAWLDAEISDSDTIGLDQAGAPYPIEGQRRGFAPEWSVFAQAGYEWTLGALVAGATVNYSWRSDIADEDSLLSPIDVAAFSHESYGVWNARVSLGAPDASWNVALLGRNLADEEYWSRASGDDLLSFTSTPARPLSWALEATFQW